jgi:hypothetical protein
MEERLSPPWEIHTRKVRELFREDEAVDAVVYDPDEQTIKVFVQGNDKAESLQRIIRDRLAFGNVNVTVTVIPSNKEPDETEDYRRAFESNPLFTGVLRGETPSGDEVGFAVFEPEVAQFFSDDISSPFGLTTMTVEQLAKDVLVQREIRVCSNMATGTEAGFDE